MNNDARTFVITEVSLKTTKKIDEFSHVCHEKINTFWNHANAETEKLNLETVEEIRERDQQVTKEFLEFSNKVVQEFDEFCKKTIAEFDAQCAEHMLQ